MSDIAVRVAGLGKRYRLGSRSVGGTAYEAIAAAVRAPLRCFSRTPPPEYIWALKNVTFELRRGEVLGIIGRNGAGKSTLLKVLSRITEPTEGAVDLYGRVSSLLEVGTGFHPELTGRENIFLNGAILGMRRGEIAKKFDEIVAFSEVERFLDTPVKHYSSGMYLRLAFAVAAHLESEIVIADEVLAVGDAAFQKKCLGKVGEVAKAGRTAVLVSHNMGLMHALAQRCLYLRRGEVAAHGEPREVIEQYLSETINPQDANRPTLEGYRRGPSADLPVAITGVWCGEQSRGVQRVAMGAPIAMGVALRVLKELHGANLTITLKNAQGERVVVLFSWDREFSLFLPPGDHVITVRIENLVLAPGRYFADVGVNRSTRSTAYDVIVDFPVFRVDNEGHVIHWLERPWGAVHCPTVTWQTTP